MTIPHDPTGRRSPPYDDQERRMLGDLCPPEELSPEFRKSVVAAATNQRQVHANKRRTMLSLIRNPLAAAAATLVLVSAGVWTWSGSNSDDLDLPSALRVLQATRNHTEGNLLAAMGAVGRRVATLIDKMERNGTLTPSLKRRAIKALNTRALNTKAPNTTVPATTNLPSGTDLQMLALSPPPLSPPQEKALLRTFATCAFVLQQVSSYSETCKIYATIVHSDIAAKLQ